MAVWKTIGLILIYLSLVVVLFALLGAVIPALQNEQVRRIVSSFKTPTQNVILSFIHHLFLSIIQYHVHLLIAGGGGIATGFILLWLTRIQTSRRHEVKPNPEPPYGNKRLPPPAAPIADWRRPAPYPSAAMEAPAPSSDDNRLPVQADPYLVYPLPNQHTAAVKPLSAPYDFDSTYHPYEPEPYRPARQATVSTDNAYAPPPETYFNGPSANSTHNHYQRPPVHQDAKTVPVIPASPVSPSATTQNTSPRRTDPAPTGVSTAPLAFRKPPLSLDMSGKQAAEGTSSPEPVRFFSTMSIPQQVTEEETAPDSQSTLHRINRRASVSPPGDKPESVQYISKRIRSTMGRRDEP